jgi:RNA polymerase sigma factor (sigma-70 family)
MTGTARNVRRELTVAAQMGIVYAIARRFRWAVGSSLDEADLVQAGAIGLMRALERFDPERGFTFATYATHWIRQAIGRAIMNGGRTIRIPVHEQDRLRREGHPLPCATLSLDAPVRGHEAHTLGDSIAASELSPEDAIAEAETIDSASAVTATAISALPERLRLIVQRRFFEDATLQAIGDELGMSRERVRQLENRALSQLRGIARRV